MPFSFLAAFLGGVISFFSPCSAMVLPAFLATGFHQRKRLILATLVFTLGLLSIILPLGLGVLTLFNLLNQYRRLITLIIGLILAIEAVMQLSGRSLFAPRFALSSKKTPTLASSYYFGLISGVGITSCVGPILGAIITLAATSLNIGSTIFLIFSYVLGITLPLFFIALLFQTNQVQATSILKGKVIRIKNFTLHSINLFAALLFFSLAYLFIIHQANLASLNFINLKPLLDFSFDLQDKLFSL